MEKTNGGWKRLLLAGALVASARPALAWGPLGHDIVAMLAQRRLSPDASKALAALLAPDTELWKIANCPDELLYAAGTYDCAGFVEVPAGHETGPYHYTNIPIDSTPTEDAIAGYCPKGACAVEQVLDDEKILADPGADLQSRKVALMFLVHLVGDEHQPLHAAEDNDRGGNGKKVVFEGRKMSLHSLWDGIVSSRDWKEEVGKDPAPFVADLEADIARQDAAAWTSGNFAVEATLESAEIARTVIYPQYAKDHGEDLGEDYQNRMRPIAQRRLEMAGVRLAALLEKALVPQSAAAPRPDSAPELALGMERLAPLLQKAPW